MDQQIAEALEVGRASVERVRRRMAERGLLDALLGRPQPERPQMRKVDGELEARLITLAWSQAEGGRERWTENTRIFDLLQFSPVFPPFLTAGSP
jgi:hypothetical protein